MSNILTTYLEKAYKYNSEELNINNLNLSFEKDRQQLKKHFLKTIDKSKQDVLDSKEANEKVIELLKEDVPRLNYKINKLVDKIRGAILVERKTTSTIYSTIIPINKQYTNNDTTTATIKDEVIFGLSYNKIDIEDITPLSLTNINFKNLRIKEVGNTVLKNTTISNLNHNTLPFEFTINLNTLVSSDSELILNLKNYAIIELYLDDVLYKEKTLNNYFSVPITKDSKNITIRSYPTLHKSSDLDINVLGITNLIYQEDTLYETKEISIGDSFSSLVLDTCDNTLSSNVKINYYLSVNNKEYERINTIHSFKDKDNNIQSIVQLSKDSELTLLEFGGSKVSEGDIRYILPDNVQNYQNYKVDIYIKNTNKVKKDMLWVLAKEDIYISKSFLTKGKLFVENTEQKNDNILIPKGIRRLTMDSTYNYTYLESIFSNDNIFSSKLEKDIKEVNDFKYISLNNVELLNANNTIDIPTIFIKDLKKKVFINTIKLKAELISLDKKSVPFISRFLIRGI